VSIFRRRTFFRVVDLQTSANVYETKGEEKSVFGEKRPINRKFSKFHCEAIHREWIHVFLPNFAEISKARVTKWVPGIHHDKKGWYFAPPPSVASGAFSPKIL